MNMKNPIYLSSWSIRKYFQSKDFSLPRLFEFAQKNGFQGVEVLDRHLQSIDKNYIQSLAGNARKFGIQINLAISNDFCLDRADQLQLQINYVLNMIRLAEQLRARIIRIYLGGFDNRFEKLLKKILTRKNDSTALQSIKRQKSIVSSMLRLKVIRTMHNYVRTHQHPKPLTNGRIKERIYRALDSVLPLAEKCSIILAIENHWGISTLPENILEIVTYYESANLGTCPDIGNFTVHQDRYEEVSKLLPYAKTIHAKSRRFSANGEEEEINYGDCIALMKSNRYRGPITVEYEGDGDQFEGSIKTKKLIRKYF